MNIKKAASAIKRMAVVSFISGAIFFWSGVMPASTVHAESCNHEDYEWVELIKPTCSKEGKSVKVCQNCEKILETESIDKLEHKMVRRKTTAATCMSPKLIEKECKICGFTTIEREGSAIDHRYKWTTTRKATCAVEGIKTGTCSICGATKAEAIAPTGKHKYGNWSITAAQISGKTLKITQTRYCKVCNGQKQTVTGKTSPFSKKHDRKKYYYKLTQKTGKVVILCSECHQSVTGKISSGTIKFTKPKKDNSKTTSKSWKRLRIVD